MRFHFVTYPPRLAAVLVSCLLAACQQSTLTQKTAPSAQTTGFASPINLTRPASPAANNSASANTGENTGISQTTDTAIAGRLDQLPRQDQTALKQALFRYRTNQRKKTDPDQIVTFDLNGDGTPEVLAYYGGEEWCAPTGCTLVIFKRTRPGYRLGYQRLAQIRRVKRPVLVAPTSHYGWRDLLVRTGRQTNGANDQTRTALLAYSSRTGYPGNAITQTMIAQNKAVNGTLLLAEPTITIGQLTKQ